MGSSDALGGSLPLPFSLLLVTDRRALAPGVGLAAAVDAILGGVPAGRVAIQLREKDLACRELLIEANALREITARRGALLLVNGRLDVALACGADGLQLGWDAPPLPAVRRAFPRLLLGASCHSVDDLASAARDGADFATFSPIFETTKTGVMLTEAGAVPLAPHGLSGLARAVAQSPVPVVALGGMHAGNVAGARAAGAAGVACIGAVLGAKDPPSAARRLLLAIDNRLN
jgi:thiamine-phosphate pyrophosphorylase